EWSVIFAEAQSAGRGRRAKVWQSAHGAGLYFTAVLYPRLAPAQLGLLPLLVGASLAQSILKQTGIRTQLKWSNDVLSTDGRKLCGVLLERTARAVLLGVGINVKCQDFPPEFHAAALEEFAPVERFVLLEQIVHDLQNEYALFLEQPKYALQLWKAQPNTLGQTVRVLEPNGAVWQGLALDIDSSGGLVLQTPTQTKIIHAAEVSLERGSGVSSVGF
ncbi:MAG: biotin--[acetyl-CoA-carboxylase] ligase, partial [Deinococcales bacterium]